MKRLLGECASPQRQKRPSQRDPFSSMRAAFRIVQRQSRGLRQVHGPVIAGKYIRKEGQVLSRCLCSQAASVSSTTETKDKEGNGGGQTPEQVAFPWRTAPEDNMTMWQRLVKSVVDVVPQTYLRMLMWEALAGLMSSNRDEVPFLVNGCARFAFIQTVRAIFAGKASVPPPIWKYETHTRHHGASEPSEKHQLAYPPLRDMMEPKLADLFEGIVERFQAHKKTVFLDLQTVLPVDISDIRLIVGPPRGSQIQPGTVKEKRFGVTVVMKEGEDADLEEGGGGFNIMGSLRPRLVDKTHYLFQMGVTFKCKEKFMVMDEDTKEVLQGGEDYRDTFHRVVYEIDFDSFAKISSEFKIIDIDGFLDGNEYLPELPRATDAIKRE